MQEWVKANVSKKRLLEQNLQNKWKAWKMAATLPPKLESADPIFSFP